jgi:hypothetical protein
VENAYDRVAKIAAVPAEQIIETERKLLAEAKANMPKLLLQPLDILLVDQLGKEFSGGGMDPYITGRAPTPYLDPGPTATRVVVLDVTDRSHGNSCGVGMADITTRRLFNKMDLEYTYANVLTSTVTPSARIGLIMDSDRLAIQAAMKTCNAPDLSRIRMARIANTLHVAEIYIRMYAGGSPETSQHRRTRRSATVALRCGRELFRPRSLASACGVFSFA